MPKKEQVKLPPSASYAIFDRVWMRTAERTGAPSLGPLDKEDLQKFVNDAAEYNKHVTGHFLRKPYNSEFHGLGKKTIIDACTLFGLVSPYARTPTPPNIDGLIKRIEELEERVTSLEALACNPQSHSDSPSPSLVIEHTQCSV